MRILAIETSCDETAAAVVEDGVTVLSNVVASSAEMHKKYGGIVPEVAARQQLESILPVIIEAFTRFDQRSTINDLRSIDAIAVTVGPGLIGSLLVGVETAKTLAFVTGKPLIPVNHVLAHMYANFVDRHSEAKPKNLDRRSPKNASLDPSYSLGMTTRVEFPAISLVVSGGHTELYLMKSVKELQWLGGTLDDAAGEAFDKTARLLGFENRGGLAIQEAASRVIPSPPAGGSRNLSQKPISERSLHFGRDDKAITLPRPLMHDETLNFSFSGLKTAILREWRQRHPGLVYPERDPGSSDKNMDSGSEAGMTNQELVNTFAHEVQEAITDVLVEKTLRAAKQYKAKSILISGGVAANSRLREKFNSQLTTYNPQLNFFAPQKNLCTDNAVYIAAYAFFRGTPVDWHTVTAIPDLSVEV